MRQVTATNAAAETAPKTSRRWWFEFAVVAILTAVIQFALYGSSFLGRTVLLPVQILKYPLVYHNANYPGGRVPSYIRSDLIQVSEPNRWFMASEYRSGRIPLWNPHMFAGTPSARAPIFSPFELLYVLWPSPKVLPWIQLVSACVGAIGAWLVAARLVGLGPGPSIVVGVVFPLSEFLLLWQGFDLTHSIAIFPWEVLIAVAVLERVTLMRVVGLALVTALEIIAGQVDMAGQVLLITGIVWMCLAVAHFFVHRSIASIIRPAVATAAGWLLGFLLTAPLLLPLAEYLKTGSRVATRSSGHEIRPPVGWKALPLIVFPEAYGADSDDSVFVLLTQGLRFNQLESAAGCYVGAVAFLFALPWAYRDRSRRWLVWCLTALAVLGVSWQLNLPGLVQIWRLPGLRLFSANRLVFLTANCILLLGAIGLEQLLQDQSKRLSWIHAWGCILTIVCISGCLAGLAAWPEELTRILPKGFRGMTSAELQQRFAIHNWYQFGWFLASAVCWILAIVRRELTHRIAKIAGVLMILDPVAHAWGFQPQPALSQYYPRLPVLQFIQKSSPGRTIGMKCLPPRLLESHGLNDIRGYDGVDPHAVIDVYQISTNEKFNPTFYSQTSDFAPLVKRDKDDVGSIQLHPTMNMVGLRYLIFPRMIQNSAFADRGFSIVINPGALPQTWIPTVVTEQSSQADILDSISSWQFAPLKQAFVTNRSSDIPAECFGEVEIAEQNPQKMTLTATMKTAGLVVIGDRYDPNWKATIDGKESQLLRVNYMLRGLVVPEGNHQIELIYRPKAFAVGVRIFQVTTVLLLALAGWSCFNSLRRPADSHPDGMK
jgi:hypothetical protein